MSTLTTILLAVGLWVVANLMFALVLISAAAYRQRRAEAKESTDASR